MVSGTFLEGASSLKFCLVQVEGGSRIRRLCHGSRIPLEGPCSLETPSCSSRASLTSETLSLARESRLLMIWALLDKGSRAC